MADPSHKIDLVKDLAKGISVHRKLDHEVLITTSDKLRLCLLGHQKILTGRLSPLVPLGIFLSLGVTLFGTDFSNPVILNKDTWRAMFIICTLISFVWLICSFCRSAPAILRGLTKGIDGTVDEIIGELRVKTPDVMAMYPGVSAAAAPESMPSAPKSPALPTMPG